MVTASASGRIAPRLRLGIVGGGQGAFIGAVHLTGARLDDRYELVAGALSSDPHKAKASAPAFRIPDERAYTSYAEMADKEAARPDGIEAVIVATPNHTHYAICKTFLEAGIDVICDKPMTTTLADALDLVRLVRRTGLVFCLTHEYTAFAMVRQAREMVRRGDLGAIRIIQIEYPQEWLTTKLEDTGFKQATWRTDPAKSGPAGALADIGTHGIHTARYITGLELAEVCADLTAFVPGRKLDDNAHVLLRYQGGARGMLWASQCAPGTENDLKVRIFGEKGSLTWRLRWPNELFFSPLDGPHQLLSRGRGEMLPLARHASHLPAGHPEGLHDAFAVLYRDAADAIIERRYGIPAPETSKTFPDVESGARMVGFIEACVASHKGGGTWVKTEFDV
ncbi:MAG: oxidoreductase [Gemmatales bacterium]|nr:MAG: oxidoreductase [Gemmatales bacterium]